MWVQDSDRSWACSGCLSSCGDPGCQHTLVWLQGLATGMYMALEACDRNWGQWPAGASCQHVKLCRPVTGVRVLCGPHLLMCMCVAARTSHGAGWCLALMQQWQPELAAGEDPGLKQEVGGRNREGHGPCWLWIWKNLWVRISVVKSAGGPQWLYWLLVLSAVKATGVLPGAICWGPQWGPQGWRCQICSVHKACCCPQRWRLLGSSADQATGNCVTPAAWLKPRPFLPFWALSIQASFASLWWGETAAGPMCSALEGWESWLLTCFPFPGKENSLPWGSSFPLSTE